jgi:hypothetical protein
MPSRVPDHDPDDELSAHEWDQLIDISLNLEPDELREAVDVLSLPALRELECMAKEVIQRQAHVLALAQNRLRALEN